MRVVLATSNAGKVREAVAILAPIGIRVERRALWIASEETGTTFAENARLKANAALRLTREPVLAEDSGLEVDALGGLPGPRSARFAGPAANDATNNEKLLRLLTGVGDAERGARYRAVAVLLLPSGRSFVGDGVFEGRIATSPRGDGGFGYDPLFVPTGEDRTVAEMAADEKNARSHRSQALRAVADAVRAGGLLS